MYGSVAHRSNTISGSDELKEKIGEEDATLLMTTVDEALAWLEANSETSTTEDLEAKQKVTHLREESHLRERSLFFLYVSFLFVRG